ncbi:MAG: efflux RND transporter periplasmic adaptor subunit [Desulfobacterales bacterium]|nr:efflux RND transporter periplasmic adaptor subunit [Desulfobacterales bacterium]
MLKAYFNLLFKYSISVFWIVLLIAAPAATAVASDKNQKSPPVPIQVACVKKEWVSGQISLIGTAEAMATSMVSAEIAGVVEYFPAKEGDFIEKGDLLVELRSTDLKLRHKAAVAESGRIRAHLNYAEKELQRYQILKEGDSIAATKYDEVLYNQRALAQELLRSRAEEQYLEYEIKQKRVSAPFSGFIAKEHTQVGEWIQAGGPVVTLVDLSRIKITVDIPERYVNRIAMENEARAAVRSISGEPLIGHIYAVLPQGDAASRTFPLRVHLLNPGFKIKSGMEAIVTFTLSDPKNVLLVPKDAVVTAGNDRLVFFVTDGKAFPVTINVLGYYDGDVAVEGDLKPGDQVVVRGNERLQPGQAVRIQPVNP